MVELLAVDLRKCVNCGACEKACAERHENGRPRLKIKDTVQSRGHMYGNFVLPINCKQCENPACIEVCKNQAIVRNDGILYIDDEKCIGCGRCVKSCPFNAIFMYEECVKPTVTYVERGILSMIFRTGRDEKTARKSKAKRIKKAYKCDRCKGYENKACIDVCFYNALSFVDVDELPKLGKPEHIALLERQLTGAEPTSEI